MAADESRHRPSVDAATGQGDYAKTYQVRRSQSPRAAGEIKAAMHGLREMIGVLEGVVRDEDLCSTLHVGKLFESSPAFERKIFQGLLDAADKAIERALDVEDAPRLPALPCAEPPVLRSLRNRQTREHIRQPVREKGEENRPCTPSGMAGKEKHSPGDSAGPSRPSRSSRGTSPPPPKRRAL